MAGRFPRRFKPLFLSVFCFLRVFRPAPTGPPQSVFLFPRVTSTLRTGLHRGLTPMAPSGSKVVGAQRFSSFSVHGYVHGDSGLQRYLCHELRGGGTLTDAGGLGLRIGCGTALARTHQREAGAQNSIGRQNAKGHGTYRCANQHCQIQKIRHATVLISFDACAAPIRCQA